MGLAQALKQEERANELLAEHQKQQTQQAAPATPAVSPAATPAAPAPASQPTPAPAAATQDGETYEARYKVLKGKYDAEVPRLVEQNRLLASNLSNATDRLNKLEAQLAELSVTSNRGSLVKPEEVEQFGEPLIDVTRRAAREELEPLLKQKDDKLAELEKQLNQLASEQVKVKQNSFEDALTAAVPTWRTVNDDPAFHAWLLDVNPETQIQRQDALDSHAERKDVAKVAAMFNEFLRQSQSRAASASSGLEQLVAPSSGSAAVPPEGTILVYTRAEIKQAFADIRAGRLPPDKAAALEADITKAIQEGRVM